MKNSLLLLIVLFIFSCTPKKNYIDGHKVIKYGTKEFEDFEKNASIKKEKAWEIYSEAESKEQVSVTHWLFFIIDKNYIFTAVINPIEMKTEMIGFSVNSETGQIQRIKKDAYINYEDAFSLDKSNLPFPFPLKRKYRVKKY